MLSFFLHSWLIYRPFFIILLLKEATTVEATRIIGIGQFSVDSFLSASPPNQRRCDYDDSYVEGTCFAAPSVSDP